MKGLGTDKSTIGSRAFSLWGYLVELLAAMLICGVIFLAIGTKAVVTGIVSVRADLIAIAVAGIAISGVVFAGYFVLLGSDFGKRLRLHRAATEYAIAFAYPMGVFSVCCVTLVFLSTFRSPHYLMFTLFTLIYSAVNAYTASKNVIDLVKVWQDVDRARHFGEP